jgi:hypothetical protein
MLKYIIIIISWDPEYLVDSYQLLGVSCHLNVQGRRWPQQVFRKVDTHVANYTAAHTRIP